MTSIVRRSLALVSATLLFFSCGCSNDRKENVDKKLTGKFNSYQSEVIAENSKFSLQYDSLKKAVGILEKSSKTLWSTSADEAYEDEYDSEGTLLTKNPKVLSPLWINYLENESGNVKSVITYSASIKKNTVNYEKGNNAITISYYFEKEGFMVPVKYELNDYGMRISVNRDNIVETGCKIVSITLTPFMCGVKNNDQNSYLFFPSGSGSIIEPSKIVSNDEINISEPVYGEDSTIAVLERNTEKSNISMPVFGVKKGNSALLAIIDGDAATASLNASVSSQNYRYSSVYPEFAVRGKQDVITKFVGTNTKYKNSVYSDDMVKGTFSVIYCPISSPSYYGMTETYREYLKDNYDLDSNDTNSAMVNFKIIGGIVTKQYILGIPTYKVSSTTTLKQVEKIIDETANTTKTKLNVSLMGYGEDGYSTGKLAGGFSLSKTLGNKKDLTKLMQNKNSNLYFNFDILKFNKGSDGFSTMFDCTKGANEYRTPVYDLQKNFRTNDISSGAYYFVSRTKLDNVNKKLNKTVSNLGITGVSFDTLASCAYSDYNNNAYYAKSQSDSQFSSIISSYKNSGKKIATHNANIYAAVLSNHIYDVPTESSGYQIFSYDIPFYEIVLKGYVPMSGSSVNLSVNSNNSILKAAETGIGLTYTVINDYSSDLLTFDQPIFYNSTFKYIKNSIYKDANSYKEYFEKVQNAKVTDHTVTSDGLRIVSFDNGIHTYVNYTDSDIQYKDILVKANTFEWRR